MGYTSAAVAPPAAAKGLSPLRVLVSAYACGPNWGSEIGGVELGDEPVELWG